MNEKNVVKFSVEGLGDFTAYKEAPATTYLQDKRTELAKLVGGKVELIKMETAIRVYRDSTDVYEREVADATAYELIQANHILQLKGILLRVPKDFNLSALSFIHLDELWMAYEVAIGNFHAPGDQPKPEEPVKTTPATE